MSDIDPDIDTAINGFNSDLPSGYGARVEYHPPELQLLVRHRGGEWKYMVGIGTDRSAGPIEWMLHNCQGELIEHEFGEAWPRCPRHGGHPLRPMVDGWHCPMDDEESWAFGNIFGL